MTSTAHALNRRMAERLDCAIARAQKRLRKRRWGKSYPGLARYIEPLNRIAAIDEVGRRIFEAWQLESGTPRGHRMYDDVPEFARMDDAFDAVRAEARQCLQCPAVTHHVFATYADPLQLTGKLRWQRLRVGGVAFGPNALVCAPIDRLLEHRGSVGVFGVGLSGGSPWPVVVDVARGASSLDDPQFHRRLEFVGLYGDPPDTLVLHTGRGTTSLSLTAIAWAPFAELWSPPGLPDGARDVR